MSKNIVKLYFLEYLLKQSVTSCISLLQIRYAEKELSITLIKFTLETNSINSNLFSFLKKSKRS